MVALSLYRGELHRVPCVPRHWPNPPRAITLQQFKLLRDKRSEALARLIPGHVPSDPSTSAATDDPIFASGSPPSCANGCVPGPSDGGKDEKKNRPGSLEDESLVSPNSGPRTDPEDVGPGNRSLASNVGGSCVKEGDEKDGQIGAGLDPDERPSSPQDSQSGTLKKANVAELEEDGKSQEHDSVKDDGKKELEKKLDVLTEKKHHLVKMLKIVLNAEEEMKRRICIQPSAVRNSASVGTDTTSVAKPGITKLTIDVHCGDRGGEMDVDPNVPIPQVSPSPRAIYTRSGNVSAVSGVSGNIMTISPRFIPGHLGHSAGLLSPSLSGTHFVASTPSPAATRAFSSVFKDNNLTSP